MIKLKQKYVPCELEILVFQVEKGFAQSDPVGTTFTNIHNTYAIGRGGDRTRNAASGNFQNQQYNDMNGIDWFGGVGGKQ